MWLITPWIGLRRAVLYVFLLHVLPLIYLSWLYIKITYPITYLAWFKTIFLGFTQKKCDGSNGVLEYQQQFSVIKDNDVVIQFQKFMAFISCFLFFCVLQRTLSKYFNIAYSTAQTLLSKILKAFRDYVNEFKRW